MEGIRPGLSHEESLTLTILRNLALDAERFMWYTNLKLLSIYADFYNEVLIAVLTTESC
jgi:hypothetical protein